MARRSIVLLAGFLVIFWDHISAQDQQQQTQDVSLGGVLVLTFQPFDRNKMFLVKRKEGEVTNIKVRTWSSWTAGSVPTLTDQASEDPAFDGRVDSTYVSISNTLTVRIKDFRATDTGPGVYYEFQQSGRRSQKFYPNIQVPPPRVSSFTITGVGEDYVNITFQQVEPWDSAPVNYSVQYKETGVALNGTWHQTDTLQHNSSLASRQINVEGLRPGVEYKIRVVSVNRFGSSYSNVKENTTMEADSESGLRGEMIAVIVVSSLLAVAIAVVLLCCYLKRNNKWPWRPRDYNQAGRVEEGGGDVELEEIPSNQPTNGTVVNITESADGYNSSLVTSKTPLLTETNSASKEADEDEIEGDIKEDGQRRDVDADEPTNHGNSSSKDKINPDAANVPTIINKDPVYNGPVFYGPVTIDKLYLTASEGSGGGLGTKEQHKPETNRNECPSPNPKHHNSAIDQFYATIRFHNVPFTSWDPKASGNRELVRNIKEALMRLLPQGYPHLMLEVVEIRKGSVIVTVLFKGVQKEMETLKGVLEQAVTGGDLSDIGVDPHYFYTLDHHPKDADYVEAARLSRGHNRVIAKPHNNDAPGKSPLEAKLEEIFSQSGSNADYITDLLEVLKEVHMDDWALFRQCCDFISQRIHLPDLNKLTAQDVQDEKGRTVSKHNNIPPNHWAIETTGNGDCLFNAVSLLLTGTEDHAALLRLGAAVYAGLNLKFIVEEFSQALSPSKEVAVDRDTALAFMTAMCEAEVVDGCRFSAGSDPTDILEYAVREEARRTTRLGNYSGRLQIKFLSGFVKHNIHLSCEDPETESCGYHDVLHTPSLDGDNLPELRIMMVYFDEKSTSLNHYVGLVEKDKDAGAIGNSTLYDEVTRLAEVTKMIGEDHADRKFVARAAQELGFTKEMAEDLIQFHSSRNVLIKLSQLWIKKVESGDAKFNATLLDKLERVFTVARSSISISNGQSPDADDDASKDEAGTNCTSQANNADPRYGKLMMMVKECDLGKDEENARKFVKAVADRLKIRIGENFFKDRNSTRVALEEVIVLWDRDIGEDATPPLLEQAFFDARKPSNLPSDVESDAEIDESEKDITVEVSEPSANRDLKAAVFNDPSQTGPEVLEEATEAVLDAEIQELAALRKGTSTAPGSDQSTSTQGSSPPKGSDINIRGNVKNLQVGDYNEMKIGGARPKTSLPKKGHSKGTSQGKDGHRKAQNGGSGIGKLTIDGDVGNMQSGDHNVMYIPPQSGPDSANSNVDTGDASSSTRVVTEEDFQEIQEHVGLKWKDVAGLLGLTEGQIDGVEHDHRDKPLDEKVYQMLRKWKQQKGESATVAALTQALVQAGLDDVASRIHS